VLAQVGRQGPAGAAGQQAFAEQHHDRDAAEHDRHADQREFEIAEAAAARIRRGFDHKHVDGAAGQHQQGAGMGSEDQRHQQLGRRPAQTDGHDDDDRQKCGHRAVHADQGAQNPDEAHHQQDQPRPAVAGLPDQNLSRPGRHARHLQPGADDEECCDEYHRRVAKARQALVQSQDSGCPERQCRTEANGDDRDPVPDEQHDDGSDDGENDPDIAHGSTFQVFCECR
jgi:hypothetical protein